MEARFSAPRPASIAVVASESLANERVPHARPVHEHDAQLSAVTVLITVDWLQCDRAAFEQLVKASGRTVAKLFLRGTVIIVRLRRVDVGYPDFHAAQPDRVAVHHAVITTADVTECKACTNSLRGRRHRRSRKPIEPARTIRGADKRCGEPHRCEPQPAVAPTRPFTHAPPLLL